MVNRSRGAAAPTGSTRRQPGTKSSEAKSRPASACPAGARTSQGPPGCSARSCCSIRPMSSPAQREAPPRPTKEPTPSRATRGAACGSMRSASRRTTRARLATAARGIWALAEIHSAAIEIEDANTPQASGFGGTLLSATASGTAQLQFTASETPPGPGIYTVIVSVDGHALYDGTPDANAGKCVSVGRDASGVPEFLYADPCPLSEQVDLPIETTDLADGRHELQVSVVDAAGVVATAYDGTITTANRTTVSSLLSSPLAAIARRRTDLCDRPGQADRRAGQECEALLRGFGADALRPAARHAQERQRQASPSRLWPSTATSRRARWCVLAHTTSNAAGEWVLHAPKGPSATVADPLRGPAAAARTARASRSARRCTAARPARPHARRQRDSCSRDDSRSARWARRGRWSRSKRKRAREWEAVGHAVRVNANGTYRYVYRSSPLTFGRRFAFRAQTPADEPLAGGTSPTRKAVVH